MAASALYPRSERLGGEPCHVHVGFENRFKRRRQKSVTWAMDQEICEVRCFVADDAPSSLGVTEHVCSLRRAVPYNEAQSNSRINVSGAKRARVEQDSSVAPGFGLSSTALNLYGVNAEMSATIPWCEPCKVFLDISWMWAGGEESLEVASLQRRERMCFEAFYPRLASVPDSPLEPLESSKESDDALVAQIPVVPLEEVEILNEDADQESIGPQNGDADQESIGSQNGDAVLCMAEVVKADALLPASHDLHSSSMYSKEEFMTNFADANIVAAAAAACIMAKALGESDLVDEKLLLEILKNPSLLKSLTSSYNFTKGSSHECDSRSPTSIKHFASEEPESCKLPTDHGVLSNRSPDSVLAQWGDGGGISNSQCNLARTANGSVHMQQATNMSTNLLPPTRLTSYPGSNCESSLDLMQIGRACSQTKHKQAQEIPKTNQFSHSNLYEALPTQDYGPRDGMGNKIEPSKNSLAHGMRLQMPARSATCNVSPAPLLTLKCLPQKHPKQVELQRFRLAEASILPRKTGCLSSRAGAKTRRLCMYFNSPRGCRNGENCAFVHQTVDSGAKTPWLNHPLSPVLHVLSDEG